VLSSETQYSVSP